MQYQVSIGSELLSRRLHPIRIVSNAQHNRCDHNDRNPTSFVARSPAPLCVAWPYPYMLPHTIVANKFNSQLGTGMAQAYKQWQQLSGNTTSHGPTKLNLQKNLRQYVAQLASSVMNLATERHCEVVCCSVVSSTMQSYGNSKPYTEDDKLSPTTCCRRNTK